MPTIGVQQRLAASPPEPTGGTTGQAYVQGSGWVSPPSAATPGPGYRSTYYYSNAVLVSANGVDDLFTTLAGKAYYWPVFFSTQFTASAWAISTATSGLAGHFGVYNMLPTGKPGAVVFRTTFTTSTGQNNLTGATFTVPGGWNFFAFGNASASNVAISALSGWGSAPLGQLNLPDPTYWTDFVYFESVNNGALVNTAPTALQGNFASATSYAPLAWLRAA